MKPQELIDLSINARMNHWPPHLGVQSDAEKIEYLATRLDEAATEIACLERTEVRLERAEERAAALDKERDDYERRYIAAMDKLERIRDLVIDLKR